MEFVNRKRGKSFDFAKKTGKKHKNTLAISLVPCYTVKAFRTEADFLFAWPVSGWKESGNFRRNKTKNKKEKNTCQSYP